LPLVALAKWGLILLFVFVFFFLKSSASAQTLPASQPKADRPLVENSAVANSYATPNTNPDVPKNLHTWTQNVMIETMSAIICQLSGIDPINPAQSCLGVDQKTNKIGFVENGGGAIGVVGNMITLLYTPPAHSGEYFQNLASGFGLVKPAHAQLQETGFKSLSPLLALWAASRNIVYLLFVILFIVIGIAIMLRVKIDPRTVMTIQNQIPKIIVGLLLVTFSFAIAGFLIDVMYASIYLFFGALSSIPNVDLSSLAPLNLQGANPITTMQNIGGISSISGNVAYSSKEFIQQILNLDSFTSTPSIILHIISGAIGTFTGFQVVGSSPTILGTTIPIGVPAAIGVGAITTAATDLFVRDWLPYLIVYIIVFFALLFALFRLWFALISAYIFLLLDVIFAPFWIAAGLIPGSPVTFGLWLRDTVSNLAAFPTTLVMLFLGKIFIDTFNNVKPGTIFIPPLVGDPGNMKLFSSFIGLGFILLTPRVVQMTKEALKAPKFDITPIKQSLGAGAGTPTGAVRSSAAGYAATHYDITGQTVTKRGQRLALGFRRLVGL